jgi:hypothetical protein
MFSVAWFDSCIVASNGGGYITANSREEEDDPSWYVFDQCTVRINFIPRLLIRCEEYEKQTSITDEGIQDHGRGWRVR